MRVHPITSVLTILLAVAWLNDPAGRYEPVIVIIGAATLLAEHLKLRGIGAELLVFSMFVMFPIFYIEYEQKHEYVAFACLALGLLGTSIGIVTCLRNRYFQILGKTERLAEKLRNTGEESRSRTHSTF